MWNPCEVYFSTCITQRHKISQTSNAVSIRKYHLSVTNVISASCSVVSNSLQPHGLYSPWNSPGQSTGVGSLSLLQGIFLTQGSNPGLPHYRWILYQLSHKGSPRILEWVAYPFSRGSSQLRNRTGVSCIAGGFLTNYQGNYQGNSDKYIKNICNFFKLESIFTHPHPTYKQNQASIYQSKLGSISSTSLWCL